MGSVHKSFSEGEVLTHTDVNDALNPTTADHVPFAVWAGRVNVQCTAGQAWGQQVVTFPVGRFTKAPTVTVSIATGAGGTKNKMIRHFGSSATQVTVGIEQGQNGNLTETASVPVDVIAIQMAP